MDLNITITIICQCYGEEVRLGDIICHQCHDYLSHSPQKQLIKQYLLISAFYISHN